MMEAVIVRAAAGRRVARLRRCYVGDGDRVRAGLTAALDGVTGVRAVAERLCAACVELLDVDGAALSVIYEGTLSRSVGASSPLSSELDELQFTLGEGPCLESAAGSVPVLVPDLDDPEAQRWPAFAGAASRRGVRAVFALPVVLAGLPVGALDLYRKRPGELEGEQLTGGLLAAELAVLPLLDLMGLDMDAAVADNTSAAWAELAALTRTEVYQAVGMLIAQLDVSVAEALVRLRGYAFTHDMTASAVAFQILDHQLRLNDDRSDAQSQPRDGG